MLGLRPEIDPFSANVYKMGGDKHNLNNPYSNTRNGRSYKFADKLTGRFFVSGGKYI